MGALMCVGVCLYLCIATPVYYSPEVTGGGYRGFGVFLLQYSLDNVSIIVRCADDHYSTDSNI